MTLDPKLNIAMTYTALGIKQYQKHMKASERNYKDIKVVETHVIPADYSDNEANDNLSLQPPDPVHANSTHKITTMDKGNGNITQNTKHTRGVRFASCNTR